MTPNLDLHIIPAWDRPGTPFRSTWAGLGNIDQFRWLVRKDCLDHLRLAHDELGLRHVRAVGMFDDELRVWGRDPAAWRDKERKLVPRLNWQVVDYAIESLLEIGVRPIFTTTFMPTALASGTTTVFQTKGNVTLPRDWAAWERFVAESVRHMVHHFGLDEVRGWQFEAWNEPNLPPFFEGTQDDFFHLWQRTHSAVKSVDPGLRIGGPSTARGEWLEDTLEWTRARGCEPDFLITHCYNNDSEFGALSPFDGPQEDRASNSPNFVAGVVRGARARIDRLGYRGELHINEWGRSWHPSDPVRESENEAAFIVKTMAEVSQQADYFAYWCLSDIYDQVGYGAETFHGNYGMLNLQGIRKPSWNAHVLLNRLGPERLALAPESDPTSGAIVTRRGPAGHVLLYGYSQEGGSLTSRKARVRLPKGVRDPSRLRLWRIGSVENNAVARWRDMGSPATLRRAERDDLRDAGRLQESHGAISIEPLEDGFEAVFDLPHPGVALLEIDRSGS